MKCNVAKWDQLVRLFLGTALVSWAVAGGPWWGYAGAILILTGSFRFCPLFALFKVRTERD